MPVQSAGLTKTLEPQSSGRVTRRLQQIWFLSSMQKKVLKCSVAYAIASLFTLSPVLSSLIGQPFDYEGPTANAHFIATVAVYYNPAKSVGAMLEADLFMLWAACFAVSICCLSMGTAVWLNRHELEGLSHMIVLAVFFAGSCGFIAFMKQRVGKATFGSACSMAALILSVVLTKEGAVHLNYFEGGIILQLLFIVFLGTFISNLVCFTVFRGSATTLLQANVNRSLDSFGTLLIMLTKAFLLEDDVSASDSRIQKATLAHGASFTELKAAFEEAKLELFDPRIQRSVNVYQDVIGSMSRLAKHLNGLREGCRSQMALLNQTPRQPTATKRNQDFEAFEKHVGPALRTLVSTCRTTLRHMRTTFVQSTAGQVYYAVEDRTEPQLLEHLQDLRSALKQHNEEFVAAHAGILKRLQREHASSVDIDALLESNQRPAIDMSQAGDFVFTVYFFLFNIDAFVKEFDVLLHAFTQLQREELSLQYRRTMLSQTYGRFIGETLFRLDLGSLGRDPDGAASTKRWSLLRARLFTLVPQAKSASLFPNVRRLSCPLAIAP